MSVPGQSGKLPIKAITSALAQLAEVGFRRSMSGRRRSAQPLPENRCSPMPPDQRIDCEDDRLSSAALVPPQIRSVAAGGSLDLHPSW